jgi:hypothetical protein
MNTEFKGDDFKFPDEAEEKASASQDEEFGIEIEEDLPVRVRPEKKDEDLEPSDEELSEYGKRHQNRFKRLTKGYNDEKYAREVAEKERQTAEEFARAVYEENRRLKEQLKTGSEVFIETSKSSAQIKLESAEKALKEAFEQGDGEKLAKAQRDITKATMEMEKAETMRPVEIQENFVIPERQQPEQKVTPRTSRWVTDNSDWFGKDDEMTMAAVGLDKKLQREYGANYVGTEEYFQTIDKVMKKRFPEYFGTQSDEEDQPVQKRSNPVDDDESPRRARPASPVAPATRSTPPSRVKLKASQVALARKLGITPEQYAKQVALINRGE